MLCKQVICPTELCSQEVVNTDANNVRSGETTMTTLINKVRSSLESNNTNFRTVEDALYIVLSVIVGSVMWLSIAQL